MISKKKIFLALREDNEPSLQGQASKGGNFTEATRRDPEVLGVVERSGSNTALQCTSKQSVTSPVQW
jgi:hypothetical protein